MRREECPGVIGCERHLLPLGEPLRLIREQASPSRPALRHTESAGLLMQLWKSMVGDERLEITSPTIQALKTLRFSTLPIAKP